MSVTPSQSDREFLKNLDPLLKVKFLVKRKMLLQSRLDNIISKSREEEKKNIRLEIVQIDLLIDKYR